MRTNQRMRQYFSHLQTKDSVLSPELSRVLVAGFVEKEGCVLLASKAPDSVATPAAAKDETGYECFINHLHVKNLGEALSD